MFKPFLTKWPFLFKFRLFLAAILLALLLAVLYCKIVPFGNISYSHRWPGGLRSGKGFIYDFKPAERLSIDSSGVLKISADPVYFSLFTPRAFDKAKVTVRYRDQLSSSTPIMEIGLLRDKVSGRYDLKPLQNRILDGLSASWPALAVEGGRLLMFPGYGYSDSRSFWKDLESGRLAGCQEGPAACLALYNYRLDKTVPMISNVPATTLTIDQPLRGAHDFFVYLPAGPWRFDFDLVDLNQDKEADPVRLRLYSGRDIIAERDASDPNPHPTSGETETKSLSLSGLSSGPGIYKMSVDISDDMVIARIVSPSDKLSFINKLWPVSGRGGLSVFTDVAYLKAKTLNPASLGQLYFGGRSFTIDKAYQAFTFPSGGGVQNIKLKSDDIVLEGNGVFALSRGGLIDPGFAKIDEYFSPSGPIRYILTDYESPRIEEGDKIAEAEFDLIGAPRSEGRYTFLLSLPGLSGEASSSYVEIKEIRVDLSGKNLWQKIVALFAG
jgi:hypothetical protein